MKLCRLNTIDCIVNIEEGNYKNEYIIVLSSKNLFKNVDRLKGNFDCSITDNIKYNEDVLMFTYYNENDDLFLKDRKTFLNKLLNIFNITIGWKNRCNLKEIDFLRNDYRNVVIEVDNCVPALFDIYDFMKSKFDTIYNDEYEYISLEIKEALQLLNNMEYYDESLYDSISFKKALLSCYDSYLSNNKEYLSDFKREKIIFEYFLNYSISKEDFGRLLDIFYDLNYYDGENRNDKLINLMLSKDFKLLLFEWDSSDIERYIKVYSEYIRDVGSIPIEFKYLELI
ncbi:MAG: hypothetical protein PUA60_07060 [Methanobacteriaceae archaeon]|nr:hypothetical protein [Methanobacteriaceae archaeon]